MESFYYIDRYGFILNRNPKDPHQGAGDGLWRASDVFKALKLMAQQDRDELNYLLPQWEDIMANLERAILYCYEYSFVTNAFEYRRHPEIETPISRDQIAMLLLKFWSEGETELIKMHSKNLKWDFGGIHKQTIDFWLWHRALARGSRGVVFLSLVAVTHPVMLGWNWLLKKIGGFRTTRKGDIGHIITKREGKLQRRIAKLLYPAYAEYILVQQVLSMPETALRRMVERILLWGIERDNWYLRTLLGDMHVTDAHLFGYVPFESNEWNNRFDGTVEMRRLLPEQINELEVGTIMLISANAHYNHTHKK